MALSATKEAIGAATEYLRDQLILRTTLNVAIGRPEAAAGDEGPKLNLFLFQVEFDGHLKNFTLDDGQPSPLWLVLRYLLTAYDQGKDSNSIAAHRLLARGLAALQELNFLQPTSAPLLDNPEPLKISFDSADVELLSKVMQGSEEEYRLSSAFQVRPILIVPDATPMYAPAVLTVGPPTSPGVVVLPSLGPRLTRVVPERFEIGATLSLSGDDVNTTIEEVHFGSMVLPVTAAREGQVQTQIPLTPSMSAGNYPIAVARVLPSGRRLTSNLLGATLMPTVTGAVRGPLTPSGPNFSGSVTINGQRLGAPGDDIFVAFFRDGRVQLTLEPSGSAAQTSLMLTVDAAHALPLATYYLIVRVNGAQAVTAPEVVWAP